jgi:hypothetical protein
MNANTRCFISRIIGGLLLPAMLSTAQAADVLQWNDLAKKIGGKRRSANPESQQYRVVTKDGRIYAGSGLFFTAAAISVSESGPSIPREQITEFRVHRYGPLVTALFVPASKVMLASHGDYDIVPLLLFPLLLPVLLGVTAVTAPIVLPIEGVKRLLPDKVYKLAP